jgi:hypothetical protein
MASENARHPRNYANGWMLSAGPSEALPPSSTATNGWCAAGSMANGRCRHRSPRGSSALLRHTQAIPPRRAGAPAINAKTDCPAGAWRKET